MTDGGSLYDEDLVRWSAEQAAALRAAAASGMNLPLDWENLAEEIESLGGSLKRELGSRMTVIVEHLLKLQSPPAVEPRRGWIDTILRERFELEQNPSLHGQLSERLAKANAWGRRNAERSLSRYGEVAHEPDVNLSQPDFELAQVVGDWFPTFRRDAN